MNNTQPKMYNDFLSDVDIPIEERYLCEGCEQWIPKENNVHTCYCAKQSRGEDISNCTCVIHAGDTLKNGDSSSGDNHKNVANIGDNCDENCEKCKRCGFCASCGDCTEHGCDGQPILYGGEKMSNSTVQLSNASIQFSDKLMGTLHFYDRVDMNIAVRAMDWALAMWELNNELRGKIKYGDESEDYINGVEWAREQLYNQLEDHGVSLEDIV